jgi:hypothetical protein
MINNQCSSFGEAFLLWFIGLFIFNQKFPKENMKTMDFCQRYFFSINTQESRGPLTASNQSKVLNFKDFIINFALENLEIKPEFCSD